MTPTERQTYKESTRNLLSSLVFHYPETKEFIDEIPEDLFRFKCHRDIFNCIKQLGENDESFEIQDVWKMLEDRQLNSDECRQCLLSITDRHQNFRLHKDLEILRTLQKRSKQSIQLRALFDAFKEKDQTKLVECTRVFQESLSTTTKSGLPTSGDNKGDKISDIIQSFKQEAQERKENPQQKIECGYEKLDELTEIFEPCRFSVIAARPGIGKTTFAINLAYNALRSLSKLKDKETSIGFISLESTNKALLENLVAIKAPMFLSTVRDFSKGRPISKENEESIYEALEKIKGVRLLLTDNSHLSAGQIREWIINKKQTENLKIVFIDYIQLIKTKSTKREENKNQEINDITRELKQIALDHGICIIGLSQLNRDIEYREGGGGKEGNERKGSGEPRLSDLRDSGGIEQDADLVIFLTQNKSDKFLLNVYIKKNRCGPLKTFTLSFHKNTGKFQTKAGF